LTNKRGTAKGFNYLQVTNILRHSIYPNVNKNGLVAWGANKPQRLQRQREENKV